MKYIPRLTFWCECDAIPTRNRRYTMTLSARFAESEVQQRAVYNPLLISTRRQLYWFLALSMLGANSVLERDLRTKFRFWPKR